MTDVLAWIEFAPRALVALLGVLALAGLLENTDRGRRLVDAAIARIDGTRP